MKPPEDNKHWWTSEKGKVSAQVLNYVQTIDRLQSGLYNKFVRLEALYDTYPRTAILDRTSTANEMLGKVTENVIASNVDTVSASIAATDVRARFMTDDGDWSTQRTAKHLEWYAESLSKTLDIPAKCRAAFKAAAIKGTGLLKVYVDQFDQIRVDQVLVDDVVVDEIECRSGPPKQMHYRAPRNREELKAQFPEFADEIERSQTGAGSNWRLWAGYLPIVRGEVIVIESWKLPIGVRNKAGYIPGRHTICIDGSDLLDEEWHKPFFPIVRQVWCEPVRGWYGISLAERIAGIQMALNKRNWQIEATLAKAAAPTTFVSLIDAKLATQTVNSVGNIAVYKGSPPITPTPPLVNPETYQSRQDLKSAAFEESGVSRMAAQSAKPAGIDSGVALREYRDQTTQRFAIQEKAFEQFYLDAIWLMLDCCKDLGDEAPAVMRRTRFGSKKIPWKQVDMSDVKVQIAAASTLSQTPAGREQTVVEWAQAGIISQDEARRLMQHPDLERAMSVYTEALENIERCIEEIADGKVLMPEPFQNLKMLVWRGQMTYLEWSDDGAPEEILETLRQYIVQAAYMLNPPAPPPPEVQPGMPAQPGVAPPMPGPAGPDAMPPMMATPENGPAVAAFAPQAMQTIAAP